MFLIIAIVVAAAICAMLGVVLGAKFGYRALKLLVNLGLMVVAGTIFWTLHYGIGS